MKSQANVVPIVMMAVALTPNAFVAAKEPLSIHVSPAMSVAPAKRTCMSSNLARRVDQ